MSNVPVPADESAILDAVVSIRNRLTALKKDRNDFTSANDVMSIYNAVLKQVAKLNTVRDAKRSSAPSAPSTSTSEPPRDRAADNRVDTTLQDVFQLLSLFFLTIGKNRESPAAYCQLATLKQLLDHMNESGVYTMKDLEPFKSRLAELRTIIKNGSGSEDVPPSLTRLLTRRLDDCQSVLESLVQSLSVISSELVPIHQRLISVRRQAIALAARASSSAETKAEIAKVREELCEIDASRVDGKFLGMGGSNVPEGQAILAGLLEESFEICADSVARGEDVADPLKPIFDRLSEMRAQLERLVLTHRWTLRETDLYNFQVSLQKIDSMRVGGKFVDSEGNKPSGQLVLLYLLRRCYGLIYRLMSSSEPISEELLPIANKLTTVKRCLREVERFGGPYDPRDLYPYRLALYQIDQMRVDGIFRGKDGSIPEGQAILNAHLAEAHEIVQSLQEEMEQDGA